MKLREIAHSRTGDKGNISNISLIAYRSEDYQKLKDSITEKVVADWFSGIIKGEVVRYELPNLLAFNFVIYEALAGGVTKSLALDTHGKALSEMLLEIEI
ncbi:MAG: hypothetical protein GX180_04130 [Enterococcus sp.]|nr:hypothetical protein [Enterococcus sp.]